LFGVDGVTGVFLGQDFISVSKDEPIAWQHLKPAVLGAIMEHYMSGAPVVGASQAEGAMADSGAEDFAAEDQEIVDTIKELIETRVRPAVANDGGDIVFRGFREGVVTLHMRGACSGCPSSTATLRNGIENLLKHFVPEVLEVRAA
jgi:Fe-S cluster biogenesis protein NfuA